MADPMKPETTPEKLIADVVANRIHGEPENYAKAIRSALRSAGFVIVPREPHARLSSMGRSYWMRAMELHDEDALLSASEASDGK